MSDQPKITTPAERGTPPAVGRRTVLRAAGVGGAGAAAAAALAACGGSSTPTTSGGAASSSTTAATSSSGSATSSSATSSSATSATSSASGGAAPSGTPVKIAEVPVGGGKAFPNASPPYVVTQPAAGEFKAFDGTCTHMRCPVTRVENGQIICPCHMSHFDISTGAPTAESQAKRPLTAKTATVSGDSVYIA